MPAVGSGQTDLLIAREDPWAGILAFYAMMAIARHLGDVHSTCKSTPTPPESARLDVSQAGIFRNTKSSHITMQNPLDQLRRQYTQNGLSEGDATADPIALFSLWMNDALDHAPAPWVEPYAMTLATSDDSGTVTARVVLLRGYGDDGFVFYTNYESVKGKQLSDNSQAALVFYWGYLERQIRITGDVSRVTRQLSEEYFHKRPRGSQIGASVSQQSMPIKSRKELEDAFLEYETTLAGNPVPLPDNWGGYRVMPSTIEFWQGRQSRLHDRLLYEREVESWKLTRLSP